VNKGSLKAHSLSHILYLFITCTENWEKFQTKCYKYQCVTYFMSSIYFSCDEQVQMKWYAWQRSRTHYRHLRHCYIATHDNLHSQHYAHLTNGFGIIFWLCASNYTCGQSDVPLTFISQLMSVSSVQCVLPWWDKLKISLKIS
jgi:hypothetical protein